VGWEVTDGGRGVRVGTALPPPDVGVFVPVAVGVSVPRLITGGLVAEADIVARKVGISPGVSSGDAPSSVLTPPDSVVRKAAVAGDPGS
jgi:hypothetical protein